MRIDKLHEYFQALMPKPSKAHKEYYKKQWNVDDFIKPGDSHEGHGHEHDEKKYYVNPNELNLYIDKAQNPMGLMI